MEYRTFGRTGWSASAISFGAWAIGAEWGEVDDRDSLRALHRAVDLGVNLFDTADVYGDGRSERLLARLKQERGEEIHVITKAGRRLDRQTVGGYSRENLTAWIERSLKNLNTETIELVQLHCPPTDVYYHPEIFGCLDGLVQAGKIRHYGVSVERVEEALMACEYPGVQSVQIIFNLFRQRPAERFFALAQERQVAILARLPLSSGMLTGKLTTASTFATNDHRQYNRNGERFDRGETFSGVDFETGLQAVEELRGLLPGGISLTQFALRWILMFPAVTCAIPGAKTPAQVEENAAAADLPPLSEAVMQAVEQIYRQKIQPLVHHYW